MGRLKGIGAVENLASRFLRERHSTAEAIESERGLQVEIGLMYRQHKLNVRFEASCALPHDRRQTKRQKRDIDLIVSDGESRLAIELKVPLAGRVPETLFDFCADIAFMEKVVAHGYAERGLCIMVTSDSQYWSGRLADGIYEPFRTGGVLHGTIIKPTGRRDTTVHIDGRYKLSWTDLGNRKLLPSGKFLIAEVPKRAVPR